MSANNKSNDNDATRIASVGDEDLVKYDVEHSEATAQHAVEKPESIRNMSAEEIKKLFATEKYKGLVVAWFAGADTEYEKWRRQCNHVMNAYDMVRLIH